MMEWIGVGWFRFRKTDPLQFVKLSGHGDILSSVHPDDLRGKRTHTLNLTIFCRAHTHSIARH